MDSDGLKLKTMLQNYKYIQNNNMSIHNTSYNQMYGRKEMCLFNNIYVISTLIIKFVSPQVYT